MLDFTTESLVCLKEIKKLLGQDTQQQQQKNLDQNYHNLSLLYLYYRFAIFCRIQFSFGFDPTNIIEGFAICCNNKTMTKSLMA